ncbi:MAG: patatin-like phospholipase family protein [Proteobacteria bacterium]|jgi:predicted acylesterase/phospholipase RssA|nr:patatin-like phospholipase family protein [Pseudomonadota bacterium]
MARSSAPRRRRAAERAGGARIGLALAGGGPLGAIYEIGALCALEEAIVGLDLNALDGYVGVSAGGLIASALANGITVRQLCTSFIEGKGPRAEVIKPALFVQPAWGEYVQRLAALPALLARAAAVYLFDRHSLLAALERLGAALPTGLLSNAPLEAQLRRMYGAAGRSNDFRRLPRRLVVVATDLDSGAAVPFGTPGWDHVPISEAVAASAALPGLFPPRAIEGRWYVDGALKKTLHASVLLDMGVDLVLCLNPLVPFQAGLPGRHRVLGSAQRHIPSLVAGGLPLVMSQALRTLIHSRFEIGMRGYAHSHPGTDIVLFEPEHHDPELFLANLFEYGHRRALAEHAYQRTRVDLRSRRTVLSRTLARHGLALDHATLDDPTRRLLGRPRQRPGPARAAARTLARLDEVLDDLERTLGTV